MAETNTNKSSGATNELHLVGIGASAGGLEAIQEFFDHMPVTGNIAFVIVQHLSSEHKSLLVQLVARHTQLKVAEASDLMEAEPNNIYVIPNNKILTIEEGKLRLSDKAQVKAPNTAIDTFLESLAHDQGVNAIAVILSGTGTDGSRGILSVQDAGGMVMVQDPETAKFNGMPNSAIATGSADYILSPKEMPGQILQHLKEKPELGRRRPNPDPALLPEVFQLVERHCGHDFTNYKISTILRRINRRINMLGLSSFRDYIKILKESSEECRFIGKEFLIGVTHFFRNPEAYEALKNEALAPLIADLKHNDLLKIWVTACSTGEEAYSIAMLVDDLLQKEDKKLEVKIFASDVDGKAIEVASKGTYPASSLRNVPQEFYNRYFIVENGSATIIPGLRKQIVFAHHNLLKDPPFIKNHLVTCRNMLIYVNNVLQKKAISNFLFSLNRGGYLFLGPSETLIVRNGFKDVNAKWKLYQKIIDNPRFSDGPSAQPFRYGQSYQASHRKNAGAGSDLHLKLKSALVEELGALALYVDQNLDIRDAEGNVNRYLALPEKFGTLNLLSMIQKDLSVLVGAAVRKSKKENKAISIERVKTADGKLVNLRVDPKAHPDYYFILLHEMVHARTAHPPGHDPDHRELNSTYVADLEEELRQTRLQLQVEMENSETAHEELQASNEELLSANEELQSSNEELQSLNEELHTLNSEHQARIIELTELNDDLDNYFKSSDLAQIFLDKDLNIRKFNPLAVKMINLIPEDIGRPLRHISTNIRNDKSFLDEIRTVLQTNQVLEREVQMTDGQVLLMRIFPFIRKDKQVDGAVITFFDITSIKELNTIIKSVFNATFSAILAFKALRGPGRDILDFEAITSNHAADALFKTAAPLHTKRSLRQHFPALADASLFEKYTTVIATGKSLEAEIRLHPGEHPEWFSTIISPMPDGFVINLSNVTEKRLADEKFLKNHEELIRTKEEYRQLNVKLEESVKQRTAALASSEERFRLVSGITSDAIWDRDLESGLIWWSDSFYFWFGYEKGSEVSTVAFLHSKIHPDDLDRVTEAIREAIASGGEWAIRYRFADRNGNYIPVFDKGMVLKDKNNKPYRLVGAITDVTAQEVARENEILRNYKEELEQLVKERTFEVEAQKEILFNLLMEAPALICTMKGPNHVYDLVNPSYQSIFGQRKLVGLPIREALPELEGQGVFEALDEVYKTGKPFIGREVKLSLQKSERMREEIYFNFIYQPFYDAQRNILGILVFAYEVSDQVLARTAIQKANEELQKLLHEFRFVTDFMPQMVWTTLPDGYHDYYNQRWYEYTGLSYDRTKGTGWATVLHPEDQEAAWQAWNHSLRTGEPYEIEYRLKRRDGEYHWFLGRALPIRDGEGPIRKWFGTCTDIHEQKLANSILEQKVRERTKELQEMNEELEASNNDLLQYASVASHDLKEPLRKTLIFGTLLKDNHTEELSAKARSYVDKIIVSSERMTRLVNDLLNYTRLTSAGSPNYQMTDLNELLREVFTDLELLIHEKKARIECDHLPNAQVVPSEIRQVFQNIISNALKFTKPGVDPHITVTSSKISKPTLVDAYDENGAWCRITIKDNGIGFSNSFAEKIFGMFQRLHGRDHFDGTGIGLAIAKKVVTKHNGFISASGEPGKGATFSIILPLDQSAAPHQAHASPDPIS